MTRIWPCETIAWEFIEYEDFIFARPCDDNRGDLRHEVLKERTLAFFVDGCTFNVSHSGEHIGVSLLLLHRAPGTGQPEL